MVKQAWLSKKSSPLHSIRVKSAQPQGCLDVTRGAATATVHCPIDHANIWSQ